MIRPFIHSDYHAVTTILLLGFKSKFDRILHLSDAATLSLAKDVGFIEKYAYNGYYIAELDGNVVGVLTLKWKHQHRPGTQLPKALHLIKKYGFKNIFRLFLADQLLTQPLFDDECYIELLGISKEYQHRGIGTALLDKALQHARSMKVHKRLSLHVAADNFSAYNLYRHLGFSVKAKEQSSFTKWLFNVENWYYMSKPIKKEA